MIESSTQGSSEIARGFSFTSERPLTIIKHLSIAALECALLPLVLASKVYLYALDVINPLHHHHQKLHRVLSKGIVEYQESLEAIKINTKAFLASFKPCFEDSHHYILTDILTLSHDHKLFKEMLKGGNVTLNDGGLLYSRWEQLDGVKTRPSSHRHKPGEAKSLKHPIFKEFLFWKNETTGDTYFQLERNSFFKDIKGIAYSILHINDYFTYKKENKQVGPMGQSVHTENNPIVLSFDKAEFLQNRQSPVLDQYEASL